MNTYFAPGCGFKEYKPDVTQKMEHFLLKRGKIDGIHLMCCHNDPHATEKTTIVNTCAGCDRRFRTLYQNITTISLWEMLLDTDFPFPNYNGYEMSIHDACPTRDQPRVHHSVRAVLEKMNIKVVEAEKSREKSRCCGSTYFDNGLSPELVLQKSLERAADFPCKDVVVYCVGCARFLNLA